jgi:NADPH2:quinone reductase
VKAAFIRETGPVSHINFSDLPRPVLGPQQCLVQVRAVSVNPIDTYVRAGKVPMKLPLPYIIGCDLAGSVVEAGTDVKRFKPGDRVWGSNQGLFGRQGTFAELSAVDEDWLYPIPASVSDETAAACALVGITAHLGLVRDAKLQRGETLFVNGGSGGVGSMVVQITKALGARVITTAGSETKAAVCRELGADEVINYRAANVGEAVKAAAPQGVNVWWETLREPDFDLAITALAPRGRMIVMAGREARPPFPVGSFYVKGCSLHGFAIFNATPDEQRRCANDLNRWLADGHLRPRIDRVLPLSQAAEAHRLQEENTLQRAGSLAGKIVLKPELPGRPDAAF